MEAGVEGRWPGVDGVACVLPDTKRKNLTLAPAPLPSFAAHFKPYQILMKVPFLKGAWAQPRMTQGPQVS